jgi:hypothetical protein
MRRRIEERTLGKSLEICREPCTRAEFNKSGQTYLRSFLKETMEPSARFAMSPERLWQNQGPPF